MNELKNISEILALTMGVSWASGINLYAAIFILGLGGLTEAITLPHDLQVLANPLIIGAAGFMYIVEFFADKVPGVDTGWDGLHTFIRIPAGALLAFGVAGEISQSAAIAAAIIGAGIAAGTHLTKSGTRVLINTSPEPFTNWIASIGEDIAVIAGLWAALNYPIIFILFFIGFVAFVIWLLPKIWRGIKKAFSFIVNLFSSNNDKSLGSDQLKRMSVPKLGNNESDIGK